MASQETAGDTRFVLVGLAGPAAGAEYDLDEKTLVGRSAEVDVRLTDDQVSRRHVQLTIVADGRPYVLAEDLQSRNGLHVNGHRVNMTLLDDGDHLLIGRTVFRLDRRSASEASPESPFGDVLQQLGA